MLILSSPRFQDHVTPPGHPERPERAHVFDTVAADWSGNLQEPQPATIDELALVHDARYLGQIAETAGRPAMLDPDTFMSPASQEIAMLAAGAAVHAARHSIERKEPAFALVRPPGHHAERNRAMGFCLYNNIAVAAAAMLARGLERIAIVDIDVHHGNGTQQIFYREPRVLYVSTHQYPFYPGTGAATEVGEAEGRGFTANIPMEAGCGDDDYALAYRAIVEPLLDRFRPELTLVSAGYDAHERDPLASMRVTTAGFGSIMRLLSAAAFRHGSLALVTEGGYELGALGACLRTSLNVLSGRDDGAEKSGTGGSGGERGGAAPSAARGDRAVAATRAALRPFWKGL